MDRKTVDYVVAGGVACLALLVVCCHGQDTLIRAYETSPPRGNLTCHRCVRSVHGVNCVNLRDVNKIEREHCRLEHNFCQVEKYITDGEVTTFSRGCSQHCKPGCERAGVNYVIEKCYSCCDSDFCNVAGGSQRATLDLVVIVTGMLLWGVGRWI